jgi:16S rRNA (guanine527-N7)-methyltransferase
VLCDHAFGFIERGALGLFQKGQDVEVELTEAAKYWKLSLERIPSRTDPTGTILMIRDLAPKT